MDKSQIESEVRRLQVEIWMQRDIIWQFGAPPVEAMFEPRVVADFLDLQYELRDSIQPEQPGVGFEAAGTLDRKRGILAISTRFDYAVQRFTAAHEIGHFVLHPWIGDKVVHRDRPIHGLQLSGRPEIEQDADYFAACLLVPMRCLHEAFEARFGTRKPLPLNETVAFHLAGGSAHQLFSAPPGTTLQFAKAVASAQSFNGRRFQSLAQQFGVSVSAMAIRLREAGLVVD
jgi:Zn-dependent peptidase ImmA (M78 family)